MELAYFYGWTLKDIRSLTANELLKARQFMNEERKRNQNALGGGK